MVLKIRDFSGFMIKPLKLLQSKLAIKQLERASCQVKNVFLVQSKAGVIRLTWAIQRASMRQFHWRNKMNTRHSSTHISIARDVV